MPNGPNADPIHSTWGLPGRQVGELAVGCVLYYMEVTPQSSIFMVSFHSKQSILGYPHFWKPPYIDVRFLVLAMDPLGVWAPVSDTCTHVAMPRSLGQSEVDSTVDRRVEHVSG